MANTMVTQRRTFVALLASFLVYAIPLPGPHAVPLLGAALFGAITRSSGNALTLPTIVFAVAAQMLTFLVVRWCLGERRRLFLLVLYVPVLVVGTVASTLLLIPRAVLISADDAADNLAWPIACSLKEAAVQAVRSTAGGALGRSGEVWVRMGRDGSRFGLMQAGDCTVSALTPPPKGTMHSLLFAVPGGITLESTWDVKAQQTFWWRRSSTTGEAMAVESVPGGVDGPPILSDDGGWMVVVRRPSPPPASPELVLRRFSDGFSRVVDLAPLERGAFMPMGANLRLDAAGRLDAGTIQLSRSDDEFLAIDLEARQTSDAFKPPGVDASGLSFRRVEVGWAAWDAYVEGRPYTIAWETTAGRGSRVVPKGRGITSLDLDPSGRWIAYSTSAIYNLGGVGDSVIIIATASGNEVFRHALPHYTRSDVAFVGDGRLAYTWFDGASQTEVRVVSTP
jgi:hypothetical protein